MLVLPIKTRWYDMILSGDKATEYRADSPYYRKRLLSCRVIPGRGIKLRQCFIRAGYNPESKTALITFSLRTGTGREDWGAEPGIKYLCLDIHDVQEVTRRQYETIQGGIYDYSLDVFCDRKIVSSPNP